MSTRVEQIVAQVKSLPKEEREEFLSWLSDYELANSDEWDKQISEDSQPGGRLSKVLDRVKHDIAEGMSKPLGDVIIKVIGNTV